MGGFCRLAGPVARSGEPAIEGAVVVEDFAVEVHDLVAGFEPLVAGRAAAVAPWMRERSRCQSVRAHHEEPRLGLSAEWPISPDSCSPVGCVRSGWSWVRQREQATSAESLEARCTSTWQFGHLK